MMQIIVIYVSVNLDSKKLLLYLIFVKKKNVQMNAICAVSVFVPSVKVVIKIKIYKHVNAQMVTITKGLNALKYVIMIIPKEKMILQILKFVFVNRAIKKLLQCQIFVKKKLVQISAKHALQEFVNNVMENKELQQMIVNVLKDIMMME